MNSVFFLSMVKTEEQTIDATKLREARGNRSAAAVARAVGISRQHLWQVETGRCVPGSDVLASLCWLYGLELSDVSNGFSKQQVA